MTKVLQVGDRIVTANDVIPLLAQYQILPQLAREIIIDQAIADIQCTPEEEATARQKFYQQNQIATDEQIPAWLEQQGMTPAQLEHVALREIKLEKFKQATWDSQVESYFLKSKGQLDRVVYSLIRTKDAGVAQEIYFRIHEQEASFAELARQYSQGPEAQTGGLIGPVELNTPHPQIAQMLMTSQSGQLWPPTRVGDWFAIIRLEQYISAQLDPPMRQRLLDELFKNWLMTQLKQTVSFASDETTTKP
jgi:parvulin-like peptidyl-prolyl isomerase